MNRSDWPTTAQRRWPEAAWITGDGPFASVSLCPRAVTVMLFETEVEAANAKKFIDEMACGGGCVRNHQVVNLGASDA